MRMLGAQVVGVDPVAARSKTPSTKRCATGSPTFAPRITCSARFSARIRIRHGPRFSIGHRPRSARANSGGGKAASDSSVACVGGGSNAIGLFYAFLRDAERENGRHRSRRPRHRRSANTPRASARCKVSPARARVLQGTYTYVLQNEGRTNRHDAFDFRGPRLSRDRARARLARRRQRAEYSAVIRRPMPLPLARLSRAPKASSPRSNPRTRLPDWFSARENLERRSRHPQSLRTRRQRHGHLLPPALIFTVSTQPKF